MVNFLGILGIPVIIIDKTIVFFEDFGFAESSMRKMRSVPETTGYAAEKIVE
jgi:hypothetical protein